MVLTMLNVEQLGKLLNNQASLDNNMQDKFDISSNEWISAYNDHHMIALRIEIHEFLNNTYKSWKYWKMKKETRNNIIGEAVDVIHFICLIINKENIDTSKLYLDMGNAAAEVSAKYKHYVNNGEYTQHANAIILDLSELRASDKPTVYSYAITVFGYMLVILKEIYGFTNDDIMQAYADKNMENYERLKNDY